MKLKLITLCTALCLGTCCLQFFHQIPDYLFETSHDVIEHFHNIPKSDQPKHIIVADLSQPSSVKRLWILKADSFEVIHHDYVAHGQNTGLLKAKSFSNRGGSHMSSEGVFKVGHFYQGKHGLSISLIGLEKGFNDNATNRHIVIHEASYVSEKFIKEHGYLGRSWGCPAVSHETMNFMKKHIIPGDLLITYTTSTKWIKLSQFLHHAPQLAIQPQTHSS